MTAEENADRQARSTTHVTRKGGRLARPGNEGQTWLNKLVIFQTFEATERLYFYTERIERKKETMATITVQP